jgi:hypothetical protein
LSQESELIMSDGYAKLLTSILDSSIWAEPDDAVRLWVTLIAMADRDGYVGASPSGIAYRTRTVSVERVNELLLKFQEPDLESRSEEFEGRRIQKVERGFLLLNYKKIRDMHADGASRSRKRKWWNEHRSTGNQHPELDILDASESSGRLAYGSGSANGSDLNSLSDLKKDSKSNNAKPTRGRGQMAEMPIPEDWTPTEAHRKIASSYGLDIALEEIKFRGHFDGQMLKSWNGRFSTWLANAAGYAKQNNIGNRGRAVKPPQPNDENNRYVPPEA